MYRSKKDPEGWLKVLKEEFEAGCESCHGGCGDVATKLVLFGKRVGAWCRGCWRELTEGHIPPLDVPRGTKSHGVINRKKLMD